MPRLTVIAALAALGFALAAPALAQTGIPLPSISDEGEGAPKSPALEPPTDLFQPAPAPGTPAAEAAEKAFVAEKAKEQAGSATPQTAPEAAPAPKPSGGEARAQ